MDASQSGHYTTKLADRSTWLRAGTGAPGHGWSGKLARPLIARPFSVGREYQSWAQVITALKPVTKIQQRKAGKQTQT